MHKHLAALRSLAQLLQLSYRPIVIEYVHKNKKLNPNNLGKGRKLHSPAGGPGRGA